VAEPQTPAVPEAESASLPGPLRESRRAIPDARARIEEALKERAPDPREWEGFHAMIRSLTPTPEAYQTVVTFRLAEELGLDPKGCLDLLEMLKSEQRETSAEAFRLYGEALKSLVGREPDPAVPLWDALRSLREAIRRRYDAAYVRRFGADRLRAVNEHLRNESISVIEDSAIGVKYAVLGVGK